MYKLTPSTDILRIADGARIPANFGNSDYQDYLRWLEEGNTPEPAFTPEELAANAAAKAKKEQRRANAQDARDDVTLREFAETTPQQLVSLINSTFNGMPIEQRRILIAIAKIARLSAIGLKEE